jgi:hypothetical protein
VRDGYVLLDAGMDDVSVTLLGDAAVVEAQADAGRDAHPGFTLVWHKRQSDK